MSGRLEKIRNQWNDETLLSFPGVAKAMSSGPLKGLSLRDAAEKVFEVVVSSDPTPQKKMVGWILQAWKSRDFLWEDIASGFDSKIADTLSDFERLKKHLPAEERSLMKYKGQGAIWMAIKPFLEAEEVHGPGGREQKRLDMAKALVETYTREFESGLVVHMPMTLFASETLGMNTKWCTAAKKDNAFTDYITTGPLAIFTLPSGKRFQSHVTLKNEDEELENHFDEDEEDDDYGYDVDGERPGLLKYNMYVLRDTMNQLSERPDIHEVDSKTRRQLRNAIKDVVSEIVLLNEADIKLSEEDCSELSPWMLEISQTIASDIIKNIHGNLSDEQEAVFSRLMGEVIAEKFSSPEVEHEHRFQADNSSPADLQELDVSGVPYKRDMLYQHLVSVGLFSEGPDGVNIHTEKLDTYDKFIDFMKTFEQSKYVKEIERQFKKCAEHQNAYNETVKYILDLTKRTKLDNHSGVSEIIRVHNFADTPGSILMEAIFRGLEENSVNTKKARKDDYSGSLPTYMNVRMKTEQYMPFDYTRRKIIEAHSEYINSGSYSAFTKRNEIIKNMIPALIGEGASSKEIYSHILALTPDPNPRKRIDLIVDIFNRIHSGRTLNKDTVFDGKPFVEHVIAEYPSEKVALAGYFLNTISKTIAGYFLNNVSQNVMTMKNISGVTIEQMKSILESDLKNLSFSQDGLEIMKLFESGFAKATDFHYSKFDRTLQNALALIQNLQRENGYLHLVTRDSSRNGEIYPGYIQPLMAEKDLPSQFMHLAHISAHCPFPDAELLTMLKAKHELSSRDLSDIQAEASRQGEPYQANTVVLIRMMEAYEAVAPEKLHHAMEYVGIRGTNYIKRMPGDEPGMTF